MVETDTFTHKIIDIGDYPESPIQESLEYLMEQVWNGGTIFIQRSRQEGAPTYFVKAEVPGIGFHTCTCHTFEEAIVIVAETHKYRLSVGIHHDWEFYTYSPRGTGYSNGDSSPRPLGDLDVTTVLPVDEVIQTIEDIVRLEMPDTTTDTLSCEIRSRMVDTGAVKLMYEEPGLLWIRGVEPRDLEPSHAHAILTEIFESFSSNV